MKKALLTLGAIVLVILVVVSVGAGIWGVSRLGIMGPGMMRGFGPVGFGIRLLGIILRLAFWTLLLGGPVLLVTWLATRTGRNALTANATRTPLDILTERYARGEIDKEQFEAIRRDIA